MSFGEASCICPIFFTTNDKEAINKNINSDTKSTTCIVDISANAHIWTIQSDFVPDSLVRLGKSDDTGVATIGGVELSPHSISDVQTDWKDNTGKSHTNIL